MKKVIYTLNINNYAPEVSKLTYPFFEYYANKIGAEFKILSERKFPKLPITCEKFQLYELSQENDWSIFVDSDLLLHPDIYDYTQVVPKDTVINGNLNYGAFRWKEDKDFLRDGRSIAVCSWFVVASDWCYDFWKPVEEPIDITTKTNLWSAERRFGMNPNHLLDEYVMSKNVAKYGIKIQDASDFNKYEFKNRQLFWHTHLLSEYEKVTFIKSIIDQMKQNGISI